jgi:hypothetical protein
MAAMEHVALAEEAQRRYEVRRLKRDVKQLKSAVRTAGCFVPFHPNPDSPPPTLACTHAPRAPTHTSQAAPPPPAGSEAPMPPSRV